MRIRIGLPAVAIALLLVADVVLLTQQDQSTAVSLDAAVQGFRSAQSSETTVATTAPADPAAPAAATTAVPGTRGAAAPEAKTGTASAPAAAATSGPFRVPAEGVYSYRTTGSEEVSLGGGRHQYPERTYAAVRAKGGCDWDFEHRVLEEHVERRVQCSAPGQLTQKDERAEITFFGQANKADYRCDPPLVISRAGDGAGAKYTGACRSSEGQFTMTTTFIGRERLTVGGVAVDAVHVLMESVTSGQGDGTSRNDYWLHADTGLMLKSVRKVQTRAKAYGSTVDYREDSSFELERLEPAR